MKPLINPFFKVLLLKNGNRILCVKNIHHKINMKSYNESDFLVMFPYFWVRQELESEIPYMKQPFFKNNPKIEC